ncbi:MAG: cation transporter [Bacteroidia bacterium]|jgi:copper chaperone CopZ|nr:cation transporter [Bacteroidia bacterium]HEX5002693.1 cation transporter [Bacteroidia bacterium]
MKHTYQVTGMTCGKCEAKVKSALLSLPQIESAEVSREKSTVVLTMNSHIPLLQLQQALLEKGDYGILESNQVINNKDRWFTMYKPVLLLFFYITVVAFLSQFGNGEFSFMTWMNSFMAGFFLAFSFFKLINLREFYHAYQMYDVIAKRFPVWAMIYPFLELGLGLAFLTNINAMATNSITFVIMGVSIIGVVKSVLNKTEIKCACLGAVFNLPMSTITIVEDALMVVMSGIMLLINI